MLNVAEDIHSFTTFKRNSSDLMKRMKKTGRPLVLTINGKAVGTGHIPGIGNNTDTFDVGYDRGSPVSTSYSSPFPFSGEVESLRVDLK